MESSTTLDGERRMTNTSVLISRGVEETSSMSPVRNNMDAVKESIPVSVNKIQQQ